MNWLFWKNDRHNELIDEIKRLAEQIAQVKDEVGEIGEGTAMSLQQLEELGGQLTKLTRVQYKSGQEIHANLEQLREGLAQAQQWQAEYGVKAEEVNILTQEKKYLLDILLRQLDEMDAVSAGLKDGDNAEWRLLLDQWRQRMITALADMGIYELDIIGKSFDPQVAEGVGLVPRRPDNGGSVPYEVAEIVRRGFTDREGRLLRKAQVITYQEVQ